jgi:hypothetical protein
MDCKTFRLEILSFTVYKQEVDLAVAFHDLEYFLAFLQQLVCFLVVGREAHLLDVGVVHVNLLSGLSVCPRPGNQAVLTCFFSFCVSMRIMAGNNAVYAISSRSLLG